MNKNDTNNSLLHMKLESYSSSDYLPMHMPGHKRNSDVSLPFYATDITEIDGFDNLHNQEGIIKDLSASAANLWNADRCILSVNGSTGLIVSSILALASRGSILIASNCHISVWHGIELSGAHAYILDTAFMKAINPDSVRDMLDQHTDIKSVVITSPTYEGVISDINSLRDICHEHDVLLMVDEAHGAHLGLDDYFPATSKADIVIKSIHKTLNAPTQTALLLTYGDKAPYRLINHYVDSTESTSPSYVLMSGIGHCISTLSDTNATDAWVDGIRTSRARLQDLKALSLADTDDPSKFVIMCNGCISGYDLSNRLREEYRIELEAAFPDYVIAMSGVGDTIASLNRFADALLQIDTTCTTQSNSTNAMPSISTTEINGRTITSALVSNTIELPLEECQGRISACYAFAYPPGVPILVPGQAVDDKDLSSLLLLERQGVHINIEPSCTLGKLLVVDTN